MSEEADSLGGKALVKLMEAEDALIDIIKALGDSPEEQQIALKILGIAHKVSDARVELRRLLPIIEKYA